MFPELHRVDLEALNNQSLSFLFPGCSFLFLLLNTDGGKAEEIGVNTWSLYPCKDSMISVQPFFLFFPFFEFKFEHICLRWAAEIHQWWNINHHRYQMDSSNNRKPLHTPTIPTNTELSLMFNFNYQLPSIRLFDRVIFYLAVSFLSETQIIIWNFDQYVSSFCSIYNHQ